MPRKLAISLALFFAFGAGATSIASSIADSGAAIHAASPTDTRDASYTADHVLDMSLLDVSLLGDPAWKSPTPDDTMMVLVELDGPTAFDLLQATAADLGVRPDALPATSDMLYEAVASRQEPARARILSLGMTIISTYDSVLNGFLVQATPEQVRALAGTPGIRLVSRAPEYFPHLSKAVPTIGADSVISALGFTGAGVNVAIIDTGIDYTHASFGGSGGYRQNNPGVSEANSFPTAKVIGGWDFAGTNYPATNPAPDNDPLDEAGHGTHVGSIAAGQTSPNVPHGVAPGANLIALKVFGRGGGTNLANDAIEWCVESNSGRRVNGFGARCDVINMSLGSNWAYGVASTHSVMRRAAEAGIVVLASAGNSGDVAYITGSPAAAFHAISVASTIAGGAQTDKIQATYGGRTQDVPAAEADPQFAPQMASIGTLSAPLAWLGRACTGDESASDVAGKIALIAYGGCTAKEVIDRAQTEGAVGAVLHNDRDELFSIGSDANEIGQRVAIPAYAVTLADGTRLRGAVEGGQAADVLFSSAFKNSLEADGSGDTISPFSSRGPSREGDFKPDIGAPGSNILAAQMASGDQPVSLSGTSMASPMAAGAAALLVDRLRKQGLLLRDVPMQPGVAASGLGALDVGALLINYTETVWSGSNRGGSPVPLARGGSGRINVLRSARGGTILRAGTIANINYGRVQFGSDVKEFEGKSFQIKNITGADKTYRIETKFLFGNDEGAGVTYGLTDREMMVPANGIETVTVLAEARSADMKPYGAYGGGNVMNRLGGVTDAEFDAHVVVTEVDAGGNPVPGGDVATLPIYMLPRATALVSAAANPVLVSPSTGVGTVKFDNDAQFPGTAELFALAAVDEPDNTGPQLNIERVGIRVVPDPQGNRMIEFAIQTQRARALPLDSSFRIYLDTNRDGKFDHQLFNDDLFFFLSGGRTAEGAQRMLRMDVVRNSPLAVRNTVFSFQNFPRVEFAEVTLDSRQIIHRMYASALGYGNAAPIAFDAVVVHLPNFAEILGSSRFDAFDAVPNGGFTVGEDGTISLTDKRISFDERRLAYTLDHASINVERGGESLAVVTRRAPEGGPALDTILAVYTQNLPGNDDVEVITLEDGEVAPPPTYTPTTEATPTRGIIVATQPPPRTPTSGVPTGGSRILLPVALGAHELR